MNKVEFEKNYFRCGVCGFKFTQPLVVFKRKNQLSKGYIIPTKPETLFVEVEVCPKCKSEYIIPVKVKHQLRR